MTEHNHGYTGRAQIKKQDIFQAVINSELEALFVDAQNSGQEAAAHQFITRKSFHSHIRAYAAGRIDPRNFDPIARFKNAS